MKRRCIQEPKRPAEQPSEVIQGASHRQLIVVDDVKPTGPNVWVDCESEATLFQQVGSIFSKPSRGDIGTVQVWDAMTALGPIGLRPEIGARRRRSPHDAVVETGNP